MTHSQTTKLAENPNKAEQSNERAMILMEKFPYDEFVSRNYMYISSQVQKRIKDIKLSLLGTGLNSIIAENLVRLGVTNLYLHDNDKVELSNLNRQAYHYQDIGKNKVDALKNNLLNINPLCQIETQKGYINQLSDISEHICQSDIIINTVDCKQIYFDIIEYGREKDKLVICPFNPGFGGLVFLFSKQSVSASEVFDLNNGFQLNDIEISRQLFEKYSKIKTISQAGQTINGFLDNVIVNNYFPQMIIGALQTTAFITTNIVKFIQNKPIRLAPDFFYIDCMNL
ncbi:MAG: ThiF family adenylyltransferase [Silvanigrellaceae bacterium]|nr:ThiF family adenylyltransferase [Silvanigrellaceae bacterium]